MDMIMKLLSPIIGAIVTALIVTPLVTAYGETKRRRMNQPARILFLRSITRAVHTVEGQIVQSFQTLSGALATLDIAINGLKSARNTVLEPSLDQKESAGLAEARKVFVESRYFREDALKRDLHLSGAFLSSALADSERAQKAISLYLPLLTPRERDRVLTIAEMLSSIDLSCRQMKDALTACAAGGHIATQAGLVIADFDQIRSEVRKLVQEFAVPAGKDHWLVQVNDWIMKNILRVHDSPLRHIDLSEAEMKEILGRMARFESRMAAIPESAFERKQKLAIALCEKRWMWELEQLQLPS